MHGFFDQEDSSCTMAYQLAKICLRVKYDKRTESWQLETDYEHVDGYGEEKTFSSKQGFDEVNQLQSDDNGQLMGNPEFNGSGCYGEENQIALYEKITESHRTPEFPGHFGNLFPIESIDVTFTVRDSTDPMFKAKALSHNSFDFGLSAVDFGIMGVLGLISSILLMFRPCVVMFNVCRKHDYH